MKKTNKTKNGSLEVWKFTKRKTGCRGTKCGIGVFTKWVICNECVAAILQTKKPNG
jgi:hypothetical protein